MTLEEFKILNEESGNHWFSEGAMSFFKSKIVFWDIKTGAFITSEINPQGVKAYSIRQADFETYRVSTVGTFHSHATLADAKKALRKYIRVYIHGKRR